MSNFPLRRGYKRSPLRNISKANGNTFNREGAVNDHGLPGSHYETGGRIVEGLCRGLSRGRLVVRLWAGAHE